MSINHFTLVIVGPIDKAYVFWIGHIQPTLCGFHK